MRLPAGQFFGTTDRDLEFDGVRLSVIGYEPSQEQPWHAHERVTFFAHLAGDQVDEGSRSEWTVPALGLIFHPAAAVHRSRLGPGGARGINLELSDTWLEAHGVRPRDLGEHRVAHSDGLRTAVLRLARSYTPAPFGRQELLDTAVEILEEFSQPGPAQPSAPWLKRVEERMRAEYRQPIGLAELAREADVHPMHLARVFRQRNGRSVTEHLQRLRLLDAVDNVLAGDSVGSAALDAGFADQFHFSRMLKAHFGYSPKWIKQFAPRTARCCVRS
ncbi:MAG: helix-turn-helix transcriptional regulator [Fimbriimonas sp.]